MADFTIALRNFSGIPVLALAGEIDREAASRLLEMLGQLITAGHYNAVINIKQATWRSPKSFLPLKHVIKLFQSHYGMLDVVADADQMDTLPEFISLCTSESYALMRILRLPELPASNMRPTPARLV